MMVCAVVVKNKEDPCSFLFLLYSNCFSPKTHDFSKLSRSSNTVKGLFKYFLKGLLWDPGELKLSKPCFSLNYAKWFLVVYPLNRSIMDKITLKNGLSKHDNNIFFPSWTEEVIKKTTGFYTACWYVRKVVEQSVLMVECQGQTSLLFRILIPGIPWFTEISGCYLCFLLFVSLFEWELFKQCS